MRPHIQIKNIKLLAAEHRRGVTWSRLAKLAIPPVDWRTVKRAVAAEIARRAARRGK